MNPSTTTFSPRPLLYTVFFIYFFCGLTLCFEGAFNPEFKDYFQLGYQQQMYTMFAKNIPFVLALAIEGLGEQTAKASGLLTMGFLGCAVLPVVQGWLADQPGLGLQRSYGLNLLAYLAVLAYAWTYRAGGPGTRDFR